MHTLHVSKAKEMATARRAPPSPQPPPPIFDTHHSNMASTHPAAAVIHRLHRRHRHHSAAPGGGDRSVSLLRRPNVDLRIDAANSAGAPANVVRQFMMLSQLLPLRSATSGNADHGGARSVSRTAISLTHSPIVLAEVVACFVNRLWQTHDIGSRPSSRPLWIVEPTTNTPNRSKGRRSKPHSGSRQPL